MVESPGELPCHRAVLAKRSDVFDRMLSSAAWIFMFFLGDVKCIMVYWLVVSNMTFIFHNRWDVILPIDELIFFRGLETTNQYKNIEVTRYDTF